MSKACVMWSIQWTRNGSGCRDDISFRARLLQDDAHTSLVSAPHAAFPPRHRTGASNALAGPGCVILIHRPNLEQIRSRESDTSPSSSLFFMFVRLAISSRNVAIARIEPMRTPFGDLQKREGGLIKEALLLTGSPWSSMPLFCLAATDVACPLAWSCGCRQ